MASNFLKNIDILADDEAPIHRINLDGKTVYHSTFGGCCTILIAMAFCVVDIAFPVAAPLMGLLADANALLTGCCRPEQI